MATVNTNIYPLKKLFAIPLRAIVQANAYAAETAIAIIRKYGFTNENIKSPVKDNDENWGELRYVSFTYQYNDMGTMKTMNIKIPLLSLIPIPLLQVKSASFDFGIRVVSADILKTEFVPDEEGGHKDKEDIETVYAMIAPSDKYITASVVERQSALTANMDVHVEMVQSDLPAGILNLINLEQQATHGNSKDSYRLIVDKESLFFSASDLTSNIAVQIKGQKNSAGKEKVITFEIIKNSDFQGNIFQTPVVTTGEKVGKSSETRVRVFSSGGRAGIRLTAIKDMQEQNGFIKVSADGIAGAEVYYKYSYHT